MNALSTDRGTCGVKDYTLVVCILNGFVFVTSNSFVFVTIIKVSFIGLRAIIFYVLFFQYLYSSIDILLGIHNIVSS